jgi:hypothetical protein
MRDAAAISVSARPIFQTIRVIICNIVKRFSFIIIRESKQLGIFILFFKPLK